MSNTDDRCVHGVTPGGAEIVRYDRAGKWYVEGVYRSPVTLGEAVELATHPRGQAFLGKLGGTRFDAAVRKVR